jgi:hypothetical protein
MSTAADRQRTYRSRQREGKSVFSFVCDEVHVKEMLRALNLVEPKDYDNVVAIQIALGKFITDPITIIKKAANDDDTRAD